MHLHFAETGLSDFISAESSGEGQRIFRVTANGVQLVNAFDVVADAAGANIAESASSAILRRPRMGYSTWDSMR